MPIATYGDLVARFAEEINDPRVTKATEWQLGLIEGGVMRAAATGASMPSGATAALLLSVLPVAADLRSTVDARVRDVAANGIPVVVAEPIATELPIGPAYCTTLLSAADIGTPSQTIEYIALLPTGEVVSIGATAPVGDTGFPAIVRSVALSLSTG